jgi:hypothetical protein
MVGAIVPLFGLLCNSVGLMGASAVSANPLNPDPFSPRRGEGAYSYGVWWAAMPLTKPTEAFP